MIEVIDAFPLVLIGLGIVVFFLLVTAFCFGMDKGESNAAKRFEFERQHLNSEIEGLKSKYIRPHGEHGRFVKG